MTRFATPDEKVKPLSLPKAYPSMMRNMPKYKWFKPLLALLLFCVFAFIFEVIVEIIQSVYDDIVTNPMVVVIARDAYLQVDFTDPIAIFLMCLTVAMFIPAVAIALKITGMGSLGTLSSVEGHLRWDLIKKIALPIFLLTAVFIVVIEAAGILMSGDTDVLSNIRFAPAALIAVIVFVPFQCIAEEYAFRGLLFQMFGSWIPAVAISCILQALLFGGAHGYELLGNVGIAINGLFWGWLTVKTGGIEASGCLHAANNVVSMLLSVLFLGITATTTVTVWSFACEVVYSLITVVFAYYLCKRNGYVISDDQSTVDPETEQLEQATPTDSQDAIS